MSDSRRSTQTFSFLLPLLFFGAAFMALSGCGFKQLMPAGRGATTEISVSRASQVVSTIRTQIGARYLYGGSTPRGFDCSGLIWWGYSQHGINIPRVTADQADTGRGISASAIRAGDILVFRTSAGLHTGIYAGNNAFIHAPSSGKRVRQESIKSAYWNPRLIAVRRVYL